MQERAVQEDILSDTTPDGKLCAHRCDACEQVFFPKNTNGNVCLKCLEGKLEDIELSGKGWLHSFSTSALPSRKIKAPYTCGYVDLSEGLRIFCRLHPDHDEDEIATGMCMQIVPDVLWETEEERVFGYYFKPYGKPHDEEAKER